MINSSQAVARPAAARPAASAARPAARPVAAPPIQDLAIIRPAGQQDMGFCLDTWLKSYFMFWPPRPYFLGGGEATALDAFYKTHGRFVADAVRRSTCLVACDRVDPNVLFGFICYEGAVVHYCYVAKAMRRQHLSRYLIDQARGAKWCSHMTSRGALLARWAKLCYKPERIWALRDPPDPEKGSNVK